MNPRLQQEQTERTEMENEISVFSVTSCSVAWWALVNGLAEAWCAKAFGGSIKCPDRKLDCARLILWT